MFTGTTLNGATFHHTEPDGSRVYYYSGPLGDGGVRWQKLSPDGELSTSADGSNWTPTQHYYKDNGDDDWGRSKAPVDIGRGLSNTAAKTLSDYIDTSSKVVNAINAATGVIVPQGYGYGDPIGGIPSEYGQSATDTIYSSAPKSTSVPDWLKTATDLTNSLGADATGRAAGRNADNNANIGYANAQARLYGEQANAENNLYRNQLGAYETALNAPQAIARNSVRGDILSNARDVSIAAPAGIPVPTISGGLRPSMFSDSTRQLGRNITANAANTPIPTATMPTAPTLPTPPVLQPMETAGTTDDIMNTASRIGNYAKTGYDLWRMFNHA